MLGKKILVGAVSAFWAGAVVCGQAVLTADFSAPKTEISKNLYGIFYEDINYAADGGLYGEMVQNRSFEFEVAGRAAIESWKIVNKDGAKAAIKLQTAKTGGLNKNNPTYAKLVITQAGDGIANSGYRGMPLQTGKRYPGSVWLRSPDGSITSVTVTVGSAAKGAKVWSTTISGIDAEWKKFEFAAVAADNAKDGQICVFADQTGNLDLDFLSLFRADIYKNQPNGMRKDLAERLEALKPAFVRFPGGCIVHGENLANRYQWKDTIGPVEERKEKKNFWGYVQSYGIGFFEYFRFCEDIGAEPLPVLSVGMAHNGEISSKKRYQDYAQDALDLIEYATGPATSEWGKKRAEAGHPAPFKLNYIGIGNEDGGMDYFDRFDFIAKAIKEKYPNIKTIISSGWTYNNDVFYNTWEHVRKLEGAADTANYCNLVDEHYYNPSSWFLGNAKRYDDAEFYKRGEGKAKVFIGEYASWVDGRRNNVNSAITEAAYMTGIERNGDVIEISSYAPLFAKEGNFQWEPDMIWFNNETSYATPDYYVQQMFSVHKADQTVKYSIDQPPTEAPKKIIGGTVGLGTWQTSAMFRNIKVTNRDTGDIIYDGGKGKLDDWDLQTGTWKGKKGKYTQSSLNDNVRMMLKNEPQSVENYTFETEAMKTGGNEGFLILFGVNSPNLYWWNMGGWGNTQSCIEKGTVDGRSIIGDSKPMKLENNKWYKIKIEVSGESYKCYLDGNLMHEFTDVMNFDAIYAHVGEKGNKVIIKLVNVTDDEMEVTINLNGADVAPNGKAYVLSGDKIDENNFRNPEKVSPKTENISNAAKSFTYKTKANSLSILELDKK